MLSIIHLCTTYLMSPANVGSYPVPFIIRRGLGNDGPSLGSCIEMVSRRSKAVYNSWAVTLGAAACIRILTCPDLDQTLAADRSGEHPGSSMRSFENPFLFIYKVGLINTVKMLRWSNTASSANSEWMMWRTTMKTARTTQKLTGMSSKMEKSTRAVTKSEMMPQHPFACKANLNRDSICGNVPKGQNLMAVMKRSNPCIRHIDGDEWPDKGHLYRV